MPAPDTSRGALIALARNAAAEHSLDAALVCAICEQESLWNPFAIRYEPAFFARYIAPQLAGADAPNTSEGNHALEGIHAAAKLSNTEAYARAFSWGLMQIMGQVAREQNFTGSSLAELCDPSTGLDFGCRVLATKLSTAQGDVARALQLWNGGGNPNYATQVMVRIAQYK